MKQLMTVSEMVGYVQRAMYARRYSLTIDEAIAELRTMNMVTSRKQEEDIRFAILIANDGT